VYNPVLNWYEVIGGKAARALFETVITIAVNRYTEPLKDVARTLVTNSQRGAALETVDDQA